MDKTYFVTKFYFEPVGTMIAIADQNDVLVLQFCAEHEFGDKVAKYQKFIATPLQHVQNAVLKQLKDELLLYFQGNLQCFSVTHRSLKGTLFQQKTWEVVQGLSYGTTASYQEVADALSKSKAVRAVGGANAANLIVILVPCHRVVRANQEIGGYVAGTKIKQWLLNHEKNFAQRC